MRVELELQGYEVQFLAVNGITANTEEYQQNLVDRCAFPLFQDTNDDLAWTAMGGGKDDMFIFRADGTLSAYLEYGEDIPTNLSTDEGYEAVLNAIMDAFE